MKKGGRAMPWNKAKVALGKGRNNKDKRKRLVMF